MLIWRQLVRCEAVQDVADLVMLTELKTEAQSVSKRSNIAHICDSHFIGSLRVTSISAGGTVSSLSSVPVQGRRGGRAERGMRLETSLFLSSSITWRKTPSLSFAESGQWVQCRLRNSAKQRHSDTQTVLFSLRPSGVQGLSWRASWRRRMPSLSLSLLSLFAPIYLAAGLTG